MRSNSGGKRGKKKKNKESPRKSPLLQYLKRWGGRTEPGGETVVVFWVPRQLDALEVRAGGKKEKSKGR